MQRFFLALVIPIIVSGFSVKCQKPSLKISQSSCNGRSLPINVEPGNVQFNWVLEGSRPYAHQTAYQLVIASSETLLESGKYDIWNTGKSNSGETHPVLYHGKLLKPATNYFWKFRVWDEKGHVTQWSKLQQFRTSLWTVQDWKNAKWIGYEQLPDSERVVPGVHEPDANQLGKRLLKRSIIPMLRKSFVLASKPKSAFLYASGLGQYEMKLNGRKMGDGFLTPGWSLYNKTCFYNCFDVSKELVAGENVMAALVGNGFYYINRERYFKLVTAWGYPQLLVRLQINYEDGRTENIITDETWKTLPSPLIFSSIYGGEDYDAQLEKKGWELPGYQAADWKNAVLVKGPAGQLRAEQDYPVAIMKTYEAQDVRMLPGNRLLYDFKQNTSGILSIKVKGKKGQKIRLVPGELLGKEGEVNQNASGKPYWYEYTLRGGEEEVWQPRFTYYGFRYVQVEGAYCNSLSMPQDTSRPELIQITLLHNRNSAPQSGQFSSSNPLFNKTHELIKRAIESNLQSVVTDCPHREKLGWLEQDFLMGNSIHYNFNIQTLYATLVQHMMDSQLDNGLVPDIAPEFVPFGGGFRDSPEWGSASILLPWMVYQWYDDMLLMEKAWPMMEKYISYLDTKSKDHILSHGLGDWYDLGPRHPGEAQLTPKALTATAIYYQDLRLMADMAAKLGKKTAALVYGEKAAAVRIAFNAKFFNKEKSVYATGSQTSMSMPLCFGMVEEQYQSSVLQNLVDSIKANGKALTAGDVGYHYLVEALTRFGASELLYEMNNREDVPGYGFQLKHGATALTESWPALPSVSNNHLMLGHLMEWFYAGLGGINQSPNSTGFRHLLINPQIVGDLGWVKTSFMTPQGLVKSEWNKIAEGLELNLSVPVNCKADVILPVKAGQRMFVNGSEVKFKMTQGKARLEGLGSGNFVLSIR